MINLTQGKEAGAMAGHTTKARNNRMGNTQKVAHQLAAVLGAEPELLAHPEIKTAPDSFRNMVATRAGRDPKYTPSDWTWKLAVAHARKLTRRSHEQGTL